MALSSSFKLKIRCPRRKGSMCHAGRKQIVHQCVQAHPFFGVSALIARLSQYLSWARPIAVEATMFLRSRVRQGLQDWIGSPFVEAWCQGLPRQCHGCCSSVLQECYLIQDDRGHPCWDLPGLSHPAQKRLAPELLAHDHNDHRTPGCLPPRIAFQLTTPGSPFREPFVVASQTH